MNAEKFDNLINCGAAIVIGLVLVFALCLAVLALASTILLFCFMQIIIGGWLAVRRTKETLTTRIYKS